MVLKLLALLVVLAGCKQSLFDAHGGGNSDGGTGNGDSMIAATCPMPCLGDAGSEFGTSASWRYLDDHRNRTWTAMTKSGSTYTGADPMNKITACAANGNAEACGALPGALLFSSAGATSAADPAIEWKAANNQVIQLQVGVFVPSGKPSQQVRLYRNSREDVLFTGTATPGMTLQQVIKVDALAGDRFLLAVAPSANGATDIGVQMFIVGDGAAFPSTCQLAVPFSAATGNTVKNLCGMDFTSQDYSTGNPTPPTLTTGPYAEEGMSAMFVQDKYFDSPAALPRPGDFTVQMWLRHDMLVDTFTGAWPFSDEDLDVGGGLGIVIYDNSGTLAIQADTCTDAGNPLMFDNIVGAYPGDKQWHFVRVVHKADILSLCVDGTRQAMKSIPRSFKSTHAPYIGKNVVWTPSGAFYIGAIDDVRVYNTALPCE